MGCVGGVVSVDGCDNIRVVTAARSIRCLNCVDCSLCIYAVTIPLLLGDCRQITMAPYNTHYPGLSCDLVTSGLGTKIESNSQVTGVDLAENAWDCAIAVGAAAASTKSKGKAKDGEKSINSDDDANAGTQTRESPFSNITPSAFIPLVVPVVETQSANTQLPGQQVIPLPEEFATALKEKVTLVQSLRMAIQDTDGKAEGEGGSLAGSSAGQLEHLMQAHFKAWLASTGHLRQVSDLIHLERVNSETN